MGSAGHGLNWGAPTPLLPCHLQFEDVSQAEDALKDTNQLSWHGRTLNVEYVANKADGGCMVAQCHKLLSTRAASTLQLHLYTVYWHGRGESPCTPRQ